MISAGMKRPRPWHGTLGDCPVRHLNLADLAGCMRVAGLSKEQPRIAIVDDDAAVRDALGDLLQVGGFAGEPYDSATGFLEDYVPGRFALVITDLRMPHMDGVELLQRLNETSAAPPALVITSAPDAFTRALAIRNGAVDCLAKPVEDELLLQLVGSLVGVNGNSRPEC